jgi:thiamine transporter
MNLFLKEKINPLIGSAGVSAVPMAARVSQKEGQKANPANFLLMHAMGPNVAGVIGSAIAAGVLLALNGKKIRWDSRSLAMGAMCIAIAFVLSCIRLYRMPQGGSITPASMLPLILFMVACGPLKGFIVGCVFGLLKLLADPYIIHPIQLLMDYPLAYGAMILGCLAALFPLKDQWKLPIAVLLACIGGWIMSVLSGVIFFAESAGEQNALVYSMVYNLSYMAPDALVCILVSCIPGMPRLVNMIRKKA